MKALLKIGYTTYLVRDVQIATKVLNLMAGAVEVHDLSWQNRVELRDTNLEIEVKVLPEKTVLVRKRADGQGEETVVDVTPRKTLRGSRQLSLPGN